MMGWSDYFQNPEFLEYTRRYMLPEHLKKMLLERMEIHRDSHILEVGCGTGYLSRYMKSGEPSVHIDAVDRDWGFIDTAKEMEAGIHFLVADAQELPFEDGTFDCVVSHTFLTSVQEYDAAVEEMKRVLKKGGLIASITSMSLHPLIVEGGCYPDDCQWNKRYRELFTKVWNLYEALAPMGQYTNGLNSGKLPRLFVNHGLTGISLFPIGTCFSVSDASLTQKEREEYIRLSCRAERRKLEHFLPLEGRKKYLGDDEANEYLALLLEKKNYLLKHLDDNSVFEWTGSASILVTGRKG